MAETMQETQPENPWITAGEATNEEEHEAAAPEVNEEPQASKSPGVGARLMSMLPSLPQRKPETIREPGATKRTAPTVGVDHAQQARKRPRRIRDVLGYKAMLPNGVAWLGEDEWSLSVLISDINYRATAQEEQERIIDQWAKFINSYGSGTRLQVNVLNHVLEDGEVAALVEKPLTGDALDEWRADYNQIVRQRLSNSNGNTNTDKILTITVQEPDRAKAETTLVRLGHEAIALVKGMDDCLGVILDRPARLRVLSKMTRPGQPFTFTEDGFVPQKRLSTLDYVAPWSIRNSTKDGPLVLTSGGKQTWHNTIWVRDYPAWLSDSLISELADIKTDITTSLHLEPYDQGEGLALVMRQIAELEMQYIEEQKKATKRGYGDEMIPAPLREAYQETKELRDELRQSNQKVFSSLLLVGVSADTEEELRQNTARAMGVIRRHSCVAEPTSYMQRAAFTSELPLGIRAVPMRRTLTTASAAIIVPFTTQEIFQPGGSYYGQNTLSGNPVVIDRTKNMNANSFVLGASGSGKGVACKHDIMNVLTSRPNDDVIIIDPEHEYEPLVTALGGQVVRVDATSPNRVNPLDIDLEASGKGTDDPITAKAGEVLSLVGALIGGQQGLSQKQRSLLDRCAVTMYREYAAEGGDDMPTLATLAEALKATNTPDGTELSDALEIYTTGSLNAFSHQTNVETDSRLLSYDISQLGPELRTFGMMVILEQIWNRVVRNRREKRRTWLYVDEFHLLFSNPYSSEYFRAFYKRARKWGAAPTGITQDVEELLEHEDARLMLANSDFLQLLRQNSTNADALCELLSLSDQQRKHFTNVNPGYGLIKSGTAVVPINGTIPTDSKLFALYNTSFEE